MNETIEGIPTVLVDVDGTLSDLRHRLHHVSGTSRNWEAFFAGVSQDLPIRAVQTAVRALYLSEDETPRIFVVTGRPERLRVETKLWLQNHRIGFDALYMRADGDLREDAVVKREMLGQIRSAGFEPFLAIDDRESVIAVWKSEGICVLQVHAAASKDFEEEKIA